MAKDSLVLLSSRGYRQLTALGKKAYTRWIRRLTQVKFERLLEEAEKAYVPRLIFTDPAGHESMPLLAREEAEEEK